MDIKTTVRIVNEGEYLPVVELLPPLRIGMGSNHHQCLLGVIGQQIHNLPLPLPPKLWVLSCSSWDRLWFEVLSHQRNKDEEIVELRFLGLED